MERRGFLKAMLAAPLAAKAAMTKPKKVPLPDSLDTDITDAVVDNVIMPSGAVIRLPSVMAATSCCITGTTFVW